MISCRFTMSCAPVGSWAASTQELRAAARLYRCVSDRSDEDDPPEALPEDRPGIVRLLDREPTPDERYSHAARLLELLMDGA
jgi:hypothetical protein